MTKPPYRITYIAYGVRIDFKSPFSLFVSIRKTLFLGFFLKRIGHNPRNRVTEFTGTKLVSRCVDIDPQISFYLGEDA